MKKQFMYMMGDNVCYARRIYKKKKIAQLLSTNHRIGNLASNHMRSCSNPL